MSDVISSYYDICNNVENQSNHSPIVLELLIYINKHITVPYRPTVNSVKIGNVIIRGILICIKLNLTLFYIILICHMPYELLQCNTVLCDVKEHVNCICKLHDAIISACLDASEIIPDTDLKSNKIPDWD